MSCSLGRIDAVFLMLTREHPILLIDSECALCNRVARFVILNDPESRFLFAGLGSLRASELLAQAGVGECPRGTFVLVEGGEVYVRSEGALRVLRSLRFPWNVLGDLGLRVPRVIRDSLYRVVAWSRRMVFGTVPRCELLTEREKKRFVDL